jgi:hypothetical protein
VVAKIEWHDGELFPRIGFIVTNSKLPAGKVVIVEKSLSYKRASPSSTVPSKSFDEEGLG